MTLKFQTKTLKQQFDTLLLQPFRDMRKYNCNNSLLVIVIDALDECDQDDDIQVLLQLLPKLQQAVSLRVFLTSRPELPIRLGFSEMSEQAHQDFALHQIPKEMITHDISLFLNHRLVKIRKIQGLSKDWPGSHNIHALVALSVPLFIFIATVCRIFEDPRWDPDESFADILEHRSEGSQIGGAYLPVLNMLFRELNERQTQRLKEEYQKILGAIVILESPLSICSLSKLIGLSERLIGLRLKLLHSVLNVPQDNNLPVRMFHISFRDFLLNPDSQEEIPIRINEKELHSRLATRCLLLCRNLKRNVCGLMSDGTLREEIDLQTIEHCVPSEMQYSCRYWAHHLIQSQDPLSHLEDAFIFLQNHFLHWVEAMSIIGLASEVVRTIDLLQSIKQIDDENHELFAFLYDAKRFVLKFRLVADLAPLQIYCSGLLFASRTSVIRSHFKQELPGWILRVPDAEEDWGKTLQTFEGHSDGITSLAFRFDSQLLASASVDHTIKLWDITTGALLHTLRGHSAGVSSVAFCAHDSHILASGSYDMTVRLWDTVTGDVQQVYSDHTDGVTTLAVSPNGKVLASGSFDRTVRLRDRTTGAIIQPVLKGHTRSIFSVAFSATGQLIASGSRDRTIRLWNAATGALSYILSGHSGLIYSVKFSPKDPLLASSSEDGTVRLWNTDTGALLQTLQGDSDLHPVLAVDFCPDGRLLASGSENKTVEVRGTVTKSLNHIFRDHSGIVRSVEFSPDGKILASGSWDHTVRLWDFSTHASSVTVDAHSDWVWSVVLSPDNQLLASASWDRTIKLWGSSLCHLQRTLKGHKDAVLGIAFSPDGRLLASASRDESIRVWDLITGKENLILMGHSDPVYCVGFSPDSQTLASGSSDDTVRLWDATTGSLRQTLCGHSRSIHSVVFSPNGVMLASSSSDHTIHLWDTATGILRQKLERCSYTVLSMIFSPDVQFLAAVSSNQTINLWDIPTAALRRTWSMDREVTVLHFSDDCLKLNTDLGSLSLQSLGDTHTCTSYQVTEGVSVLENTWITLNGERILWLPPEYRPVCSVVHRDNIILGHASGRISFLGFSAISESSITTDTRPLQGDKPWKSFV
ncbi:NACHT and WD40 domain protein [Penicillium odoratum]|uniref:NACHT and WD40 domain protein n=1 Tax=Penicillium odoratum TaxID=1167516 RepID=UPI0025474C9A|nr:NACHT and WD40 domain protein [Penicillium odoratum]KAJ5768761.1 NACHT and WD40 domain protein [Penicillium odoratum]